MAWAPVSGQHAHAIGNSVATFDVAMPGNVTNGDKVVIETESFNGATTATTAVSKSAGTATVGTFTEDVALPYTDGSFASRASKWSVVVTGTGSLTIRVTVNNNANVGGGAVSVQEYSGVSALGGASDIDVSSITHGTSATASTTTAATSSANDLVSGGYTDDGNNITITGHNGTGFTERDSNGNSSVSESYLEDKDSGASGSTQTANMSTNTPNGGHWVMSCVCYLAAGGGGGTAFTRGLSFAVTPSFAVAEQAGFARGLSWAVAPSFALGRSIGLTRALAWATAFTASISRGVTNTRGLAFSVAPSFVVQVLKNGLPIVTGLVLQLRMRADNRHDNDPGGWLNL